MMTRPVIAFALVISTTVLVVAGTLLGGAPVDFTGLVSGALQLAAVVATAAVGHVLALRRPRNPIGWLFAALALASAANVAALGYATRAFAGGVPLPAAEWAAWFGNWSDRSSSALILVVFLLFPSGRVVSPRWRPAFILPPLVALGFAARAFVPGPMLPLGVPNPLGLGWIPPEVDQGNLGGAPLLAGSVIAFVQLVVRYRAAGTAEREQIKWLAFPVVALFVALVVTVVGILSGLDQQPDSDAPITALYGIAFLLLPVGMGIAVLRHRLYDIDLLINRALVYGPTSVGVAGAFLAGIVLLQALLRPVTGGSELAVAASTLASLAVFQPVRRRIQGAVDRRFYRSKYDAERTLDAFSAQLREEVALDAVRADLLEAVRETLQPSQVSLWLRADQPASS